MHRYEYDADNRLTHVYTSDDGIIWEKDAKYFYYRHGPLARTEVGDLTVQGIDYAYTLQGWIKGINSNILNPLNDIGKDAMQNVANLHQNFANDLAAYSLKYYGEDYQPIAYNYPSQSPQITDANNFIANTNNITNLAAQSPDLYNGNISQMITTIMEASNSIKPQLTAYRYDQLNRIKQMKTFAGSSANNAWSGVLSEKYAETYRYDANGNIVKLTRNDASGALFDDLMYGYKDINDNTIDYSSNNNLLTWELAHNKLETVIQNAGTASGEFVSSNYIYDNIGNLRSDDGEKITDIEWNIYGKISKITKGAPDNIEIEFKYDAMGNRVAKIIKPAASLDNPQTWNYSFYTRDAQGNTMANYKMQYSAAAYHTTLTELDIYGSSRLGVKALGKLLDTPPDNPNLTYNRYLGYKHYEISNHLGNVITVFSDRKIAQDLNADGVIDSYKGVLLASNDYTPFGMQMANRGLNTSIGLYRFGFNGKEKDDEVKGTGNSLDFGARIYDSRTGRFLSIDPMWKKVPSESNYLFAGNNPIYYLDIFGMFKWPPGKEGERLREKYPHAYNYIMGQDGLLKLTHSEHLKNTMIKNTYYAQRDNPVGFKELPTFNDFPIDNIDKSYELTPEKIIKAFTPNQGPYLKFTGAPGGNEQAGGYNPNNTGDDNMTKDKAMQINESLLQKIEDSYKSPSNIKHDNLPIKMALLKASSVIIHEYMEYYSNDEIMKGKVNDGGTEVNLGCNTLEYQIWGSMTSSAYKNPIDKDALPSVPQKK